MDLQRPHSARPTAARPLRPRLPAWLAPSRLRRPGTARWAVFALLVLLALAARVARGADNGGLGPLSVRNQFPVALPFLHFTPEAPLPIPSGAFQLRYQHARTNTFINTQSPTLAFRPPEITQDEVAAGLTAANFQPDGYGLYLDVEADRRMLRLDYGLADWLQVGLELAWVTFGGGYWDAHIEGVEQTFNGFNEARAYAERDRFDYYVAYDGQLVYGTSTTFRNAFQDPVLKLKWNWSEGGDVLPAITVLATYKYPIERHPEEPRRFVASGNRDAGYYLLLSKAVGDVVGHLQFGVTRLDVGELPFKDKLYHKLFGLEFRLDPENSLLLQSLSQSSIFRKRSIHEDELDYFLSRQTDELVLGYKHGPPGFLFEVGVIEDYFQQKNDADVTFYMEAGWQW